MNIIDIINNRHSYRGKYKPISVPREDLITIIDRKSVVQGKSVDLGGRRIIKKGKRGVLDGGDGVKDK